MGNSFIKFYYNKYKKQIVIFLETESHTNSDNEE